MFPMIYSDWWANLAVDIGVILLAVTLDWLLPEPPARVHPVVWMGRMISGFERIAPQSPTAAFVFGAGVVAFIVAIWGALAWLAMVGLTELGTVAYVVGGAVLLRTSFTVQGLIMAGAATQQALETEGLERAQHSLRSLVSRERDVLSAPLVAASAIESVAENTTDSYIAPWLAFAMLGVPFAVAYRAINTLDSMWSKRG